MPSRSKKTYHKKNYRTKRRSKRTARKGVLVLSTPSQVIPRNVHVVMKTRAALVVTGATAQSAEGHVYVKANSLYRPFNATGQLNTAFVAGYATTTTPTGYDIYLPGMYTAYRVYDSKVIMRSMGIANSGTQALRLCLTPLTGTQVANTFENACQAMYAKESVGLVNVYNTKNFSNRCSVNKAYGVPKRNVMVEEDYSASYNLDPSNTMQWDIWYKTSDGAQTATGANTITIDIELIQWAVLEIPNLTGM